MFNIVSLSFMFFAQGRQPPRPHPLILGLVKPWPGGPLISVEKQPAWQSPGKDSPWLCRPIGQPCFKGWVGIQRASQSPLDSVGLGIWGRNPREIGVGPMGSGQCAPLGLRVNAFQDDFLLEWKCHS